MSRLCVSDLIDPNRSLAFTVSAEGRVENQKLNQTAALLSFGGVFGFRLDLVEKNFVSLAGFTSTQLLIILYHF